MLGISLLVWMRIFIFEMNLRKEALNHVYGYYIDNAKSWFLKSNDSVHFHSMKICSFAVQNVICNICYFNYWQYRQTLHAMFFHAKRYMQHAATKCILDDELLKKNSMEFICCSLRSCFSFALGRIETCLNAGPFLVRLGWSWADRLKNSWF